jgi:hypothetical protein
VVLPGPGGGPPGDVVVAVAVLGDGARQELPDEVLPAPMPEIPFPHTSTGTVIGTVALLPEPTPGELLDVPPVAPPVPPVPPPVVQTAPPAELPAPATAAVLPQKFTGTSIGTVTLLPEPTPPEFVDDPPEAGAPAPPPEEQAAPVALFAAPTPVIELPHAFTGTSTGTVTLLPATTPGELLPPPTADADGAPAGAPVVGLDAGVPHAAPEAELAAPMRLIVLPDTHTGALTGTETLLPDSTPGEPAEDCRAPALAPGAGPVDVGAGVVAVGVGVGVGAPPLPVMLPSRPPRLDVQPLAELPAPMPVTSLQETLMGALTGAAALLPDAIPGESLEVPEADAPSATAYPTLVSNNPPVATAKAKPRLARSCIEETSPIT